LSPERCHPNPWCPFHGVVIHDSRVTRARSFRRQTQKSTGLESTFEVQPLGLPYRRAARSRSSNRYLRCASRSLDTKLVSRHIMGAIAPRLVRIESSDMWSMTPRKMRKSRFIFRKSAAGSPAARERLWSSWFVRRCPPSSYLNWDPVDLLSGFAFLNNI
jgi:hypothetical protein